MSRPSLSELRKKALEKRAVKAEYDRLAPAFELRRKLIEIRLNAGLTQEQMAQALNTSKGNISRLENVNSSISPTIRTITRYAEAAGYTLDIRFLRSGQG
jgi:DNA-binding XRE family transcriptional regulator